jgi:acetyl-CoA carboxylase beta subunit
MIDHGFVDMIVKRKELKRIISKLIMLHGRGVEKWEV